MVILGHNLGKSQVSVNRTIGPTLVLDLNLSIHNDTVSTKIYDKRDDFDFDIVNFPFLDVDVPLMVYISTYSLCQSIFACY